jgi:hypothetical protein
MNYINKDLIDGLVIIQGDLPDFLLNIGLQAAHGNLPHDSPHTFV